LWGLAVGLLDRHSITKVAKRLGLNPTHLSRRKTESALNTPFKEDVGVGPEFAFVSVPVANPTAVSLRVERPDGTKLILEFQNANLSDIASFCAAVR
jgi:AraC-like DNA-binding protein